MHLFGTPVTHNNQTLISFSPLNLANTPRKRNNLAIVKHAHGRGLILALTYLWRFDQSSIYSVLMDCGCIESGFDINDHTRERASIVFLTWPDRTRRLMPIHGVLMGLSPNRTLVSRGYFGYILSIPVKMNTSYSQPPNVHPKNGATIGICISLV